MQGRHREAVAVRPVLLGHELVVETAQRDPYLVVEQLQQRDPDGRVEHGEVDARLAQALVVAGRGADRGVVLGARRDVPGGWKESPSSPLVWCHVVGRPRPTRDGVQRRTATVVAHEVGEDRKDLHDVTISVEYRVTELLSDQRRARRQLRAVIDGTSIEASRGSRSYVGTPVRSSRARPTTRGAIAALSRDRGGSSWHFEWTARWRSSPAEALRFPGIGIGCAVARVLAREG